MPKCKDCIHFFVCANMYADVQAETEIVNYDGEQCYYFKRRQAEWKNGVCTNCGASVATDSHIDYIDEGDNKYCYNCGAEMTALVNNYSDGGKKDVNA